MDGLDLMTAAEIVPITAALVRHRLVHRIADPRPRLAAAALCGAMLGFVPFNRPVAKIFLGDVGSLPIGLLVGWCLLQLALHQHVAAALLLPLYYLARRHRHAVPPHRAARTVLGGASLPLLPARHRQRLLGVARGARGVRAQPPAGGARDRLDRDVVDAGRVPAVRHRRHRHGAFAAPVLSAAALHRQAGLGRVLINPGISAYPPIAARERTSHEVEKGQKRKSSSLACSNWRSVWIYQRQGDPVRFDSWLDQTFNLRPSCSTPIGLTPRARLIQSDGFTPHSASRFHRAEETNPLEPVVDTHSRPLDARHRIESER